MRADDPRADDPYDDEPYDDPRAADSDPRGDSLLPYAAFPLGWSLPFGPSNRSGGDVDTRHDEGAYDEGEGALDRGAYDEGTYDDEDGSWGDEGVIALLLIGGVTLFLIPEPLTSTLGIVLIAIGVIAWLVDVLGQ